MKKWWLSLLVLAAVSAPSAVPAQTFQLLATERLSVGTAGAADDASDNPAVPLNGRYVAFESLSTNLTEVLPGATPTPKPWNIFTRSLESSEVTRISFKWYYRCLTMGGTRTCSYLAINPDGSSTRPAISPVSPEKRYVVAFQSTTQNFLAGSLGPVPEGFSQLFMYDPNWRYQQDRIKAVSMRADTACSSGEDLRNRLGNAGSYDPSVAITPGEAHVAYATDASNLYDGDANGVRDVLVATVPYLEDHAPPAEPTPGQDYRCFDYIKVRRVTVRSDGIEANAPSEQPKISGDGAHLVFASKAANLNESGAAAGALPYDNRQILLYNAATRKSVLVSKDASGLPGNADSSSPNVSYAGTKVVYLTSATNIGGTSGLTQVIVYDAGTGKNTQVNTNAAGEPSNGSAESAGLSPDGRYAVFSDTGTNLVAGDTNGVADIFVKDLVSGEIVKATGSVAGTEANGDSNSPTINFDGYNATTGFITYASNASDLVTDDVEGVKDIFRTRFQLSSPSLARGTKLEVPADVDVTGKTVSISMKRFSGVTLPRSGRAVSARAKRGTIKYVVEIRKEGAKRATQLRTVKRNLLTMRGMAPGLYSVRYSVSGEQGSKTVTKTKSSPKQLLRVS